MGVSTDFYFYTDIFYSLILPLNLIETSFCIVFYFIFINHYLLCLLSHFHSGDHRYTLNASDFRFYYLCRDIYSS